MGFQGEVKEDFEGDFKGSLGGCLRGTWRGLKWDFKGLVQFKNQI